MAEINLEVEHDGTTFYGNIAEIQGTSLTLEDHGIFTAYLHTKWIGCSISVGGMCLDEPLKDTDGSFIRRVGSNYGCDFIMRLIETVGVYRWEELPHQKLIVLFEDRNLLGRTAAGIAGLTNGKVMIFKDHAKEFNEMENQ